MLFIWLCTEKMLKHGSRLQVWRKKALQTTGGLKRVDLTKNKSGKIVSRKKSVEAKRKHHLGPLLSKKKRERQKKNKKTDLMESNIIKGRRTRGLKKRKTAST